MSNLSDEFCVAFKQGNLLEVIHEKARGNWGNLDVLVEELIGLHNNGEVDIIASFKALKNGTNSSVDFFLTRHVLEKALPKLDAPISDVMECVLNLVDEAGQDLAAGTLLPPFIDFCASNVSRPKDALVLIEKYSGKYVDLLPQVIVAGARFDTEFYLSETIRLVGHRDIEIRRRAVFSLGRIERLEENGLIDRAISCLESSVKKETDDRLLSGLIKSIFSLYKYAQLQKERAIDIINRALSHGDDYTLHAGTELLCLNFDELPEALLDCLLLHLLRIKHGNKGSLKNIDCGLAALIVNGNWKGVEFLENLLLANPQKLSIGDFERAMQEILKNPNNIFNRLMTKWFMEGDRVLCEGIGEIASLAYDGDVYLTVSSADFDCSEPDNIIFLARKAIGYLSSTPITAASIVLSLMQYTSGDASEILINLLLDFLLINYPGKVGDYLKKKLEAETGNVKEALEIVIKLFNEYFEGTKSAGNIPELHPPQLQRDIYNRQVSRLMADAMKNAQKGSALLSLVSTSVLLYGRKSIDYVYNSDGRTNRMEIPLQAHSFEGEFPRLAIIDPFGWDYSLRIFRAERIKL